MQFLNFTPQETKALIFLLSALLLGSGIALYKRTHPQFAPELIVEKKEVQAEPWPQSLLNKEREKNKIDLNQATTDELQLIPGLGPTLSKRIVEYRENHGQFQKIEDIMQVQGIGLKTFQKLQNYITVE